MYFKLESESEGQHCRYSRRGIKVLLKDLNISKVQRKKNRHLKSKEERIDFDTTQYLKPNCQVIVRHLRTIATSIFLVVRS